MKTLYGRVLRAARKAANITQVELAVFLGMSQSNLSDIELGKYGASTPTQELADFLDTDHGILLAAWKFSQPYNIQLDLEDISGRRYWFHAIGRRDGLGITMDQFDRMMREHVDENHPVKGRR